MLPIRYYLMISYSLDELIDMFAKKYADEYGQQSLKTIINHVGNSKEVTGYIELIRFKGTRPNAVAIVAMLRRLTQFRDDQPETWCIAGLAIILFWQWETDPQCTRSPKERIVVTCAELIMRCSEYSEESKNNFFTGFFEQIKHTTNIDN